MPRYMTALRSGSRAAATTMVAALLTALPTALQAQTVAITGGKVFPVSGPAIENGTVLIRDGRIVAVGADVTIPADARRVDAAGRWVTPGFINPATHLGAVEIGAVGDTRDYAARGEEGVAAAFRVVDGLNPRSTLIAPALDGGVTSTVVLPAGGMVAGQAAFVDLTQGASATDMTVRPSLFMVAQMENSAAAGTGARGELASKLRGLLEDARVFGSNRTAFDAGELRTLSASRADLEALQPVLSGDLPLLVSANRAADIQAALRLAADYRLELLIEGGAEAWMVADELARAKVPVLTGAMNNIPGSFATLGSRQENAAILRRAGVTVLLTGDGGADPDAFNVRNLRYAAGNAVAYGLSWEDALRAVTLAPAEAFGLGDSYGSLQPGRVANVVVWSGDPFEFTTMAEHVYVRGQELSGSHRQEQLEERYRTLPPDYFKTLGGTPGSPR